MYACLHALSDQRNGSLLVCFQSHPGGNDLPGILL